jgi:hypothetical protein
MEKPLEDVSSSFGDRILHELAPLVPRLRSESVEGSLGYQLRRTTTERESSSPLDQYGHHPLAQLNCT